MKKIILKSLNLENFKGRTMSFDFSDERTVIRGTNEAGKSTLTNAFFWLLMGVDAQDRTNYELYDSTLEFTPENAIPAVVEGVFDVDGTEYSFKRVAKQKWVRPRGKSEYVKDKSDEYTFYVDGLAVSANVYKERVEALFAPIDKLKLMLNVRYYQTLDWKKLRKHFSDMVGIIDESELQGDYASIKSLLDKFGSVDAVKEKLRQEINPLKRTSENIDAEIKGMKSMLPSLDGVAEAERERGEKTARISEIDKEILGLGEANKPFVEKRNAEERAIVDKQFELQDARSEWNECQCKSIDEIKRQLANIKAENDKISKDNERIETQRRSLNTQLEIARHNHQFYSEERDRLAEEKDKAKALSFDENQVCQSCGQPLPYDKVAEIRERFYADRDAKVKAIIEKGVRARDNRDAQEALIKALESQIQKLPEAKPLLDLAELEAKLALAKANIVPFEQSDIYAQLTKEIADMEANLTVVPEVDSAELVAEKSILTAEIGELQAVVAKEKQYNDGKNKIARMESEKSPLGVERARLDGLLRICIERDREYASIVRDRANKYLEYAQVEMIELNKGGDVTDICKLSARNVPADVQNNETQVNIGVDVARAFQKNIGVNLPILIDNMEGIVDENIPDVDNQLILFYVDKFCPKLTTFSKAEWQAEENRRIAAIKANE